ncbi:tRNA (guanine-N(1)-)-methyltransferase [compost metagenome]
MTRFIVLSLFPEMFDGFINTSIIKRSIESEKTLIELINIRDFSINKNRKADDTPYGGGNGMVMMCEPLCGAIDFAISKLDLKHHDLKIIYLSPRGKLLNYTISKKLSDDINNYILICGHYEGIDERVIEKYNIEEISIGDYILTGGELPAMVLMDSIIRLKPNVLSAGSLDEESHTNYLLEYPQYTKPSIYNGLAVPEVLLSGNHKNINEHRRKESIWKTYKNRPDLIQKSLEQQIISKKELNDILNEKGGE